MTHKVVGKQLLLFLGEMVPKLKSRQSKSTSEGASQSAASGGSSKKKKGKKK